MNITKTKFDLWLQGNWVVFFTMWGIIKTTQARTIEAKDGFLAAGLHYGIAYAILLFAIYFLRKAIDKKP